ncbi:hypothetical protein [Mycobacterium lacus]|uniref:Uncharacterized protein n=1 Tax=Mycobacterium lacus TaxID=169765 RepID=A0A1X1XUW9_9MYCO|nr:hypothetical protein [Mycobacterium lacus]MCV7122299.1 hypothetical protein [Mycobacterium lacus]ORW02652.1 hypothetical protein AWC15_06610 [Mycobacterium lacus]BBX97033.1 hypothetical protein MLAC_23270 [Mycobacterium lacus]
MTTTDDTTTTPGDAQTAPGAPELDDAAEATPDDPGDATDALGDDGDGDDGGVPSYEELEAERDHWKDVAGSDKAKLAAEAAGYRTKLRATEEERDAALGQVAGRDDALFTAAVRIAGCNPGQTAYLRTLVDPADHVVDGAVDLDSLAGAIDHARAEAGLTRRPRPNPAAGRRTDDYRQRTGRDDWDAAFGLGE